MSDDNMTPENVPVMFTMIEPGLYEYSVEGVESLDRVQVKRLTSKTWGLFLSLNDAHPVAEYRTKRECEDHLRATAASAINALRRAAAASARRRAVGTIERHDRVTISGADPRVWVVTGFRMSEGMRWAELKHEGPERITTSVPVKRLEPATSQDASRPTTYPEAIRPYIAAVEKAVADLVAGTQPPPVPAVLTPAGLTDETGDHDLTALLNLDDALMTRIIQRAQYEGIVAVHESLKGWIETARENHEALCHRGENVGSECWRSLAPEDVESMLNDAARALGVRLPAVAS